MFNLEKLDNESESEYLKRLYRLRKGNEENLEILIEIINIEWREVFEKLANS